MQPTPARALPVLSAEAAALRDSLLNIDEVSAMLGIHKASIYRIEGFPKPRKIGNQNRWWLSDIVAYINRE